MERKGTEIGERRSKHWVAGLLLALSVSFSLSLSSLSLSPLSLSLPQVADLNSVRVAPLKLSCCSPLKLTTAVYVTPDRLPFAPDKPDLRVKGFLSR